MVGRLTGIGIPRQSMNITPHEDDSYHVAVHTHEANRDRVTRAAEGSPAQGMLDGAKTGAILGGGFLLGAAVWAIWQSARRHREVPDRSRLAKHRKEPATQRTATLREGRQTTAAAPGETGLGSGLYTSREQSVSNIGSHNTGYVGGGSAGQGGAPEQPTDA
jgi:hypothetical protein